MTRLLILVVFVSVLGYGFVKAWALLAGPTLSLASPGNDASIPGGIVTVSGKATRTVALKLDGATILPDENGAFSSVLTFPHGASILTITATDRFGRTVSKRRTIFVP